MHDRKPSHHSLLPPPQTPAQAMFDLARTNGWAPTKSEFARLAGIDKGNVFNYLADAWKENRIHATTDTLRRWATRISDRTALRVTVSEDADGDVIVAVHGMRRDGGPVAPGRRTCRAADLNNHRLGHPEGQRTCDALVAALGTLAEGITCEHHAASCLVRVGASELRIRHNRDDGALGAWASTGSVEPVPVELAGLPLGAAAHLAAESLGLLRHSGAGSFWEGAPIHVPVTRYERSPGARRACLANRDAQCAVCDLIFADVYGPLGEGFIHVHHVKPLRSAGARHKVNPVRDLVPVCANCHAMIHRYRHHVPTIAEMRALVARYRASPGPTTPRGPGRARRPAP